jgi:pimeloyl-ACP methyl ester carboxylesterase
MPLRPTLRPLAAILIAALLAVAWSSGLETIELDGHRATFDPSQAFTIAAGDLDCTLYGGTATIRVTETHGRLGEADYLIYQPAIWNGDLVLWAHGAIPPFKPAGVFWFPVPLGFGTETTNLYFARLRNHALCNGFAWAASAFARHGAAIAEGIRDTHLLNAIAPRHLGAAPAATYVTGHSLGGLVTIALAEQFPHRYAGALTTSGSVAGTVVSGSNIVHMRLLLDVFFPGLLEGPLDTERAMTIPEFDAFAAELQARVQADPDVLRRMASVRYPGSERVDPDGVGRPLLIPGPTAPLGTLGESLLAPMSAYLIYLDDYRARGGVAVLDNRHFEYTGFGWTAEEEADLNAGVARLEAEPWAVRYWTFHYLPSGELRIPVVSVASSHDPAEPVSEWAYAQSVARTGSSDLYSAWVIPRYGHVTTPEEYATALLALVDWVETGVRPTWPTSP